MMKTNLDQIIEERSKAAFPEGWTGLSVAELRFGRSQVTFTGPNPDSVIRQLFEFVDTVKFFKGEE
jgi:hypothetical protein